MTKRRELKGNGEFDYDFVHDILFFKVKNRVYEKSIEINNMIIDIDSDKFIAGIQIFDASEYFNIPKKFLSIATSWKFQATTDKISESEIRVEIRLFFEIKIRNKIVQPNPIIVQNVETSLPDSRMISVPAR
ncbi:MAG: DUF2283 domain-containing protein [Candidatus Aenigmarchaeota archaeon]|nr:DUF2283 domain-containing protein [Candidatus Aenigmarchaeota archaeon]